MRSPGSDGARTLRADVGWRGGWGFLLPVGSVGGCGERVAAALSQESRVVRVIRKQLVRRALEMMDDLASKEGGEDYKTFWESFGRNLKVRGTISRHCICASDGYISSAPIPFPLFGR